MRSLELSLLAVLLTARVAGAQHGFWQPDDRLLITSFHNARGIATDQRLVFVATTNGLEVYDQTFKRWLPPSTIEDGYPAREGPARIAYDVRERGVWLVTEVGTLYAWSTAMQRWQQRFASDAPEDVIRRLQRGAVDRDPAWAVMRNFAGRDAAGRTWPVTGLEPAERSGTFWAATNGGNFSYVDTRSLSSEQYVFGTVSRGVSALALAPDGYLWFGGDAASSRNGVARSDTILQRWQHFESRTGDGPQARVHALAASTAGVYAASADGVYVWRNGHARRVSDLDARALAHTAGRLWVGARGTLGWLDGTDQYQRTDFPVQTINALSTRNDTLWIGAETGLFAWSNDRVQQLAAAPQVVDVAASNHSVVTVTARGVQIWDGTALGLPLRNAALQQIGRALSISGKSDRVWIGGTAGLAEWNTTTDAWRYLTVPSDIPEGPVYDILEENGRIWLATPAGALRLNWK